MIAHVLSMSWYNTAADNVQRSNNDLSVIPCVCSCTITEQCVTCVLGTHVGDTQNDIVSITLPSYSIISSVNVH